MSKGLFIVVEGGEGAGKTTAITAISKVLEEHGHTVETTREPGGTVIAEQIRDFVLSNETGAMDPMTEAMLFQAARNEHVKAYVQPAVESGKTIISDRFYDSTFVYQGVLRGANTKKMDIIHKLTMGEFKPDLILLLNVDAQVGRERVQGRDAGKLDRMGKLGDENAVAIQETYLQLASRSDEYVVIDANPPMHVVEEEIIRKVEAVLRK